MENLAAEYCQHEVPSDETLLIACREGQDLIVQNLTCSFDYDISDGRAITVAVAKGHTEILKSLTTHSQKVATKSFKIVANATSLLNLAATHGHEKVVDMIFTWCRWSDKDFEKFIYIDKNDERTGRTALFSAVMSGNESITRNLLTRGAKLNSFGNTALHIAAKYGHHEILGILFEAAAIESDHDINTNEVERTGLIKNHPLESLLGYFHAEGETALHKAAKNGHSDAVRLIMTHQPYVDERTVDRDMKVDGNPDSRVFGTGFTALHLAAWGGHLEVVRLLIDDEAGIKENTIHQEWTALYLAAAEGHDTVVQWLQENGASLYADQKTLWML